MAKNNDSVWVTKCKNKLLYTETKENHKNCLIDIIKNANASDLASLFSFLKKNQKLKHLISKSNIRNASSICTMNSIAGNLLTDCHDNISDYNIFIWSQLNIEYHKDIINDFIIKKEEFTKYRLLSNIEEADNILNKIENKYGYSWWLLESKISLLHESGGKAAQVEYINNLLKNSRSNPFFSWLLQLISERNEDKTQLNHFFNRLNESFENYDGLEIVSKYTQKTVIKNYPFDDKNYCTLLIDSFTHIIDLYENYINVIVQIFNSVITVPNYIVKSIRNTSKKIKSREIINCLISYDKTINNIEVRKYRLSKQGELFLSGNFLDSINLSLETLKENPNDLESIIIASSQKDSTSKIEDIKGSLLYKIIYNLNIFRKFDKKSPSAYSNLKKITANNYTITISKIIDSIIIEKSNLPLIEVTGFSTRFLYSKNIDIFSAPLLCDKFNTTQKISKQILEIKNVIHYNKENNYYKIEELTKDIIDKYTNKNDEFYEQNKAYILNQRTNALLNLDKIYECMISCVDSILSNEFLLTILPVSGLIKGKRWPKLKEYRESIELSIIIYLYLILNEDSLQKSNLGFAWDWFRKSHGIYNICDLLNDEFNYIDRDKLIYFLSEISTPEIMENHSEGLNTPDSTLISRSQILAKLIECDKSKNKFYEKEQVSLLKTISIQRGLDKLNQNKLYIDNNIIKSWATRELESSYERYQENLSHPELFISNKDEPDGIDTIVSMIQQIMEINKDEYVRLFRTISEEYLNNKQGGLNFFLSMRIRHGKLEGTLRKPLSDNDLITTKNDSEYNTDNSSIPKYNFNSYWVNKLNLNDSEGNKLNEILSDLSYTLDLSINDYKNNKIRCYSDKFPYGLFYINPSPQDLLDLKNKIATGVSFSVFCNESIDLCQKNIENRLPHIKNLIDKEIIEKVSIKLENCLKYSEKMNYKELSESIKNSRSQFLKTGKLVKEWFNFDNVDINNKSLTLEDCIDISLINIQDVHSPFTCNVSKKLSEIKNFKLSDIDSNNINEVLYIMLDNIYKRSGVNANVKIRIKLNKYNSDHVRITMINEVNEDVINCVENITKLKEIKEFIDKGVYQSRASDDNNSGLLKLRNMNQSKNNDCLNFGFKFKYFYISYNLKLTISKGF